MSEVSEGLSDSGWSMTMGHSWCAWCLRWGLASVCICASPDVRGVCVCHSPLNSRLDSPVSRRPRVWTGVSCGWRVCAGIWGHLQVWGSPGMSVCVCLQQALTWTSWWVGDLWGGRVTYVCMCACMSDLPSLPEGTGLSVLIPDVSPTRRCCWRQRCLCVCPVHLGAVLSFPAGWARRRERGSHIPSLGRDPSSVGHRAGLQRPGRRDSWARAAGGGVRFWHPLTNNSQ